MLFRSPGKRRQPKTSIFWGQDNIFFTPAGGETYLKDLTARESFVFTPVTLSWETISALFRSTGTARRVLYRPLRANQNWDGAGWRQLCNFCQIGEALRYANVNDDFFKENVCFFEGKPRTNAQKHFSFRNRGLESWLDSPLAAAFQRVHIKHPMTDGPHLSAHQEIPYFVLNHDDLAWATSKPALGDFNG